MSKGKCNSCGKGYTILPEDSRCDCGDIVLLFCPCCGGDAELDSIFIDNTEPYYVYDVSCSVCGLITNIIDGYESPIEKQKSMSLAMNEVVTVWNRRVY